MLVTSNIYCRCDDEVIARLTHPGIEPLIDSFSDNGFDLKGYYRAVAMIYCKSKNIVPHTNEQMMKVSSLYRLIGNSMMQGDHCYNAALLTLNSYDVGDFKNKPRFLTTPSLREKDKMNKDYEPFINIYNKLNNELLIH